ncbi:MAG: DNA polymerase III subunit alpha, partial [Bacilli bacterium]|nr:DNA polymerase III subunit alpha [Bacilli bacterium]
VSTDYSNYYMTINVLAEDELTTEEFISDINVVISENGRYIPKYNDLEDSAQFLDDLAHKGLNKRLKGISQKNYEERLDYELGVIKKMGFVDYFLIVYDYVLYAKKNNILVGPGRGSAAGSLVSFCLGITNVDPIKYDLLFERFLNPERVTMPDIDIDFEYTKRGQVIDYVRKRYGENKVAPIMTFGTLGSKQVLRDVARVLDIEISLIDKFVRLIDAKISLKENITKDNVKGFLNNYPELKKMYQIAMKLEGLKRHISTHAAGVVISSVPLDEVIPIIKMNEFIMTGVTMEYLENLGLLKMDFLALRNLTIIGNVLELIKENAGKVLDLNKINMNTPEIFKMFSEADTEGIFQYESSGMKNLMQKLKPSSFSDLVASVALFRPGPMDNIDLFIARKYGKEKVNYLHPDLKPILESTYGVIVYQEQVMEILVKIGGYSYAEADNIRRAMSKKKEAVMLSDREHFVSQAINRGYNKNTALDIYNLILKFANYGFNKAHSVSYALIGYQMAYLKTKFPMYFITNLLNMSIGSEIKTKEYIDEAKKKGIKILKPDINLSQDSYLIVNDALMLPLSSIKNLGVNATSSILEERGKNGEFVDYLDFVARTYGKSVNKKTIVSLIEAGVLDSFKITKKTMIQNLDIAINYADLISNLDASLCLTPAITEYPEYEEEELRVKEFNSYGFYVTNHPVSKYMDKNIVKLANVQSYFDKHIKCVVLVEKVRTIKTKKGDQMAFLTASDETGNMEFVIFPTAYYMLANVNIGDIIMVQGKVTKRFDSYQISVDFLNKI